MSAQAVLIDGRPGESVSVFERGLHYGDGLFETLACRGGRARLLGRHLARLEHGCARLGIRPPEPTILRAEIERLAAGPEAAVVKLLLLRGCSPARGYDPAAAGPPTRVVLRYPWPAAPLLTGTGVRVRLGRLRLAESPSLAGLKHCNRLEQVLARAEWQDPTIAEALLFTQGGELVGGTASNVFLVQGGRLLTPQLERCGVAGVMRATVLELAQAAGIPCAVLPLRAAALDAAEEIFLTSALLGIRPVSQLEERSLPHGPVTGALSARLSTYLEGADGR